MKQMLCRALAACSFCLLAALTAPVAVAAGAPWDAAKFERYGGPGGGPRPPIAPFTTEPLPARKVVVPMVFPVIGARTWRDGYNVDRGAHRHTGIDILAPKMRPVVAPFAGILGFKTQTFWIWGDNGYKCLGTHLNDDTPGTNDNRATPDFMFAPNLRPGDRVVAGQLIGYVGDSGVPSGSHLHFELFAPGNQLVNPFPSLKAAGRISAPRAVFTDPAARPSTGEVLIEGCVRGWDPARRALTLLPIARRTAGGRAFAHAVPASLRLTLPRSVVEAVGGSAAIGALPRDRAITLIVSESAAANTRGDKSSRGPTVGDGTTVRRFVLPAVSEDKTGDHRGD